MHVRCALAWALLALLFGVIPGHAQRVALVIGNSSYQNVPALPNPASDAADIASALERLGFTVRRVMNGTSESMRTALRDFVPQARRSEIAVVFFAGHGIEVGGENWLIPVDAELKEDIAAEQEAIALRSLLPIVGAASKLGLVILDACRNNPFAARMQRALPTRTVVRGLARVEPTGSVLVAYAAKDGTAASDGAGRNSPFTTALLQNIETPGLEVNYLFRNVREAVLNATNLQQEPVVYGSLPSEPTFLKPAAKPGPVAGKPSPAAALPAGPAATRPADPAGQAWTVVQNTRSVAVLEDFIRQFGGTPYGSMARARLDELRREIAAVAPPASAAQPPPPAPPPPAKLAVVAPPAALPIPSGSCGGGLNSLQPSPRQAAPLSSAEECALKPSDVFKECSQCPEMVVVPAGAFTMGSPESENGRDEDEGPLHQVTFVRPFAVGRFLVTVDQFAAFVAETRRDAGSKCQTFESGEFEERSGRSWRTPGFPQRGNHPVVCVDWDDVKAYADWVARKTGKLYRVPTEAEWEYAARGRTQPGSYPRYWFGNDEAGLCRYGNVADQTVKSVIAGSKPWAVAPCNDGYAFTSPVGSFAANPFGLYDMLGNAFQWTADCNHDSYEGAPSDGSAWTPGSRFGRSVMILGGSGPVCPLRPARGGSWYNIPKNARTAVRQWVDPVDRIHFLGFRLARTLTP
jgi:formylglycine-generating enzyme required for sulfatase activity